jgi:phage tail-like protein
MSRLRFLDMLQVYPFWVFDASGFAGNPLLSILDPVLGFSACTMPEITIEHREIQPGNWEYKRRAVKTADVGSITLSRGARFYDSDFYIWLNNAIKGKQPLRRNLVLVHFMGYRPLRQALGRDTSDPLPDEVAFTSLATRLPARAWHLVACLPSRYKAGGDFDAAAGDVSIQELEVQPEHVDEFTVATLSPIVARSFSLGIGLAEAGGNF